MRQYLKLIEDCINWCVKSYQPHYLQELHTLLLSSPYNSPEKVLVPLFKMFALSPDGAQYTEFELSNFYAHLRSFSNHGNSGKSRSVEKFTTSLYQFI